MARRITRTRPASRSRIGEGRQGTREHLLEAAGRVFAEKGFERSTAKEISERARTNTAAVNYYFGGIEGLYAAVLEEARNRIFAVQTIETAIAGQTDPKAKLEAVLGVVMQTLLGPVSSSWVLQVDRTGHGEPIAGNRNGEGDADNPESANPETVHRRVDGSARRSRCRRAWLYQHHGADLYVDSRGPTQNEA